MSLSLFRYIATIITALSVTNALAGGAAMPGPEDTTPYAPHSALLPKIAAHSEDRHYAFYLSGGAGAENLTNNNSVVMDQSGNTNLYYTNAQTDWSGIFGIGFGMTKNPTDYLSITLDPALYLTGANTVEGIEYPFASTPSTLNYQFNVRTLALLLESHFVYTAYAWQPLLVVGVGGAWNELYNYSESANGSGALPAISVFGDNTTGNFACEVGVGLQHALFIDQKHDVTYSASLDYRYFYFGSGELAQTATQVNGTNLQVNTIDMQTIMLSLNAAV